MPAVETMNRSPVGAQGSVDTSGLLIETMQLEQPTQSCAVPNHLLETSECKSMRFSQNLVHCCMIEKCFNSSLNCVNNSGLGSSPVWPNSTTVMSKILLLAPFAVASFTAHA